ncbi:sodium:solute symporter family protein [Ekhidna sp. MALMAid0563]|uniref:sodium:solute symporter family protein n=1 Tax=Ekhidna sp. MALMAid0563 TaxID=3143937 RepID=UPI0032DF06FA
MALSLFDWIVIGVFFLIVLGIGLAASKTAGKSSLEYFLAGKSMPWWLLGVSMVATTFSADTPNLVTGFVREGGVAKNWAWWSFLITGMVTVFIYARLWRRSEVLTDLEFYELRYGGKAASFLRGFRALYLGVFFNCLIMGSVTLAAIKISSILFGIEPIYTVVIASVVVAAYSALGGIKGVIWTDFFQFGIALVGAIYAAYVAVSQPQVGGLSGLLAHESLEGKFDIIPDFSNTSLVVSMFIIPLAVQWWSVWYPGAEPGGGGYIAQRMLAAKNERHAVGATLFFNFAHYALRPWPWILVALASIILFPDLDSIQRAFPHISEQYLGDDIAYPVMLTLLSPGWLGLVVASLIAAYMSTISTHLNWGSSYVVNDFYQRFVKPDASEKELVLVGRLSTVALMLIAGALSLTILENATQAFNILLLSGAGTGAIFLFRWFWWRINAITEIVGMVVATINAFVLVLGITDEMLANHYLDAFSMRLLIATAITTVVWILTALLTKPEDDKKLASFVSKVKPGIGWQQFEHRGSSKLGYQLLSIFVGTIGVYAALFAIGNFLYGNTFFSLVMLFTFSISVYLIIKWWKD